MNKVPIFSYFLCKIPIFFPYFLASWIPIFLFFTFPITWCPGNPSRPLILLKFSISGGAPSSVQSCLANSNDFKSEKTLAMWNQKDDWQSTNINRIVHGPIADFCFDFRAGLWQKNRNKDWQKSRLSINFTGQNSPRKLPNDHLPDLKSTISCLRKTVGLLLRPCPYKTTGKDNPDDELTNKTGNIVFTFKLHNSRDTSYNL